MSKITKFDLHQLASGEYLCEQIPDDWEMLEVEQQNDFLLANAWEPMEGKSADDIWDLIDCTACSTMGFLQAKGIEVCP